MIPDGEEVRQIGAPRQPIDDRAEADVPHARGSRRAATASPDWTTNRTGNGVDAQRLDLREHEVHQPRVLGIQDVAVGRRSARLSPYARNENFVTPADRVLRTEAASPAVRSAVAYRADVGAGSCATRAVPEARWRQNRSKPRLE